MQNFSGNSSRRRSDTGRVVILHLDSGDSLSLGIIAALGRTEPSARHRLALSIRVHPRNLRQNRISAYLRPESKVGWGESFAADCADERGWPTARAALLWRVRTASGATDTIEGDAPSLKGAVSPTWGVPFPLWREASPFKEELSLFQGATSPKRGSASPIFPVISPLSKTVSPNRRAAAERPGSCRPPLGARRHFSHDASGVVGSRRKSRAAASRFAVVASIHPTLLRGGIPPLRLKQKPPKKDAKQYQ